MDMNDIGARSRNHPAQPAPERKPVERLRSQQPRAVNRAGTRRSIRSIPKEKILRIYNRHGVNFGGKTSRQLRHMRSDAADMRRKFARNQ